ncbi:hypothetical protein ABIE67_000703 [Streptomyces sp. V4I8]
MGDAVLGREALGDGVRKPVHSRLLEVRAAPGLQDRGVVVGAAERREQERADLALAGHQMRVAQRLLQTAAVLDRVEGRVGPGGQPVAQQGAGAAVVHPGTAQRPEESVDALGWQQGQPPGDQTPFAAALLHGGLAGRLQQPADDQRGVVVVDVESEHTRVEVAVVAQHVRVQKVQGEPLSTGVGVELALPGRGDRGIDEQQHVIGRDQIPERLHAPPPRQPPAGSRPGNGGTSCESLLHRQVPEVAPESRGRRADVSTAPITDSTGFRRRRPRPAHVGGVAP